MKVGYFFHFSCKHFCIFYQWHAISFFWISLWWIILKAVSQNIIHACTCVQIYVSKLRCESYSRRIQACIFGYDHQLNDDCSPKKCIANICNMHDTQMTSIEFCFLTKYSIIILLMPKNASLSFSKLILFSKNCFYPLCSNFWIWHFCVILVFQQSQHHCSFSFYCMRFWQAFPEDAVHVNKIFGRKLFLQCMLY